MNVLAVISIVLSGIALIFLSLRLWLYSKYIDYLNKYIFFFNWTDRWGGGYNDDDL